MNLANCTLDGLADSEQGKGQHLNISGTKNFRKKNCKVIRKLILAADMFLLFWGCFLTLCLFFIMQSQHFFCFCGGNHTMADTDCFIFSVCTPSRVCYCRTGGYAGQGGNAEPAESDHFLSNNLKSCGVGGVQERGWMRGGR